MPKQGHQLQDEEIARLVKQAKAGDERSQLALYDKFKFFLLKYQQMLKGGPVNLSHSDLRGFISLYVTRKLRGLVLSGNITKEAELAIYQKINELRGQYAALGSEDVDSIIKLTFYQCLSVYDDKGKVRKELKSQGINYDDLSPAKKKMYESQYPAVGFEGFLMNYYKYLLRKNLDKEARGLVAGIGWCQPEENQHYELDRTSNTDNEKSAEMEVLLGLKVTIDHDWVDGKTANFPFSELTRQERWILKLRFIDKMYAIDIADQIGVAPSAIRGKLKEIREKLEKLSSL